MSWVDLGSRDFRRVESAISTYLSGLLSQTESPDRRLKDTVEIVSWEDEQTIRSETREGECLRLGTLPYRPGDNSKQVDVYIQYGLLIKGREIESEICYEIVKSSTEIVYLDVTETEEGDETRERLQGLHFDFDLNPDYESPRAQTANHPVFHAQYNPNCVSSDAIQRWNPEPHGMNYPEYPRIPCAPFDIVSAGYMILNDHLPKKIRDHAGWPSGMIHEKLPRFPEKAFEYVPEGGRKMSPEWWYIPTIRDSRGNPVLNPDQHRPL